MSEGKPIGSGWGQGRGRVGSRPGLAMTLSRKTQIVYEPFPTEKTSIEDAGLSIFDSRRGADARVRLVCDRGHRSQA